MTPSLAGFFTPMTLLLLHLVRNGLVFTRVVYWMTPYFGEYTFYQIGPYFWLGVGTYLSLQIGSAPPRVLTIKIWVYMLFYGVDLWNFKKGGPEIFWGLKRAQKIFAIIFFCIRHPLQVFVNGPLCRLGEVQLDTDTRGRPMQSCRQRILGLLRVKALSYSHEKLFFKFSCNWLQLGKIWKIDPFNYRILHKIRGH